MEQKHMEDVPSDLQGKLLDGSENIYKAAFSSARRDGLDEDGARSVAWNTVSYAYAQGEDGCWHRKPDVSNISHKSVQSGGN
ncbi:ChaB family protein [Ancylothrix sp. C2]|uniref:ChaB family protein n=1 Tax=Ancylothrix sp. D3o TaxID=2953691 RepID=UPI0021BAE087|nr:ChaB family protein [Ancylothrix sp. D3o]MCT7952347.1 ChaB family protein [Ancylothrix sp. D3o]